MTSAPAPDRPLRRDAQRNRDRIVLAAQEIFDEQGIDAPIRDIARRAGVGVATLYRRFPERESLVEACFRAKVMEYLDALEFALEATDPWQGFAGFVERVCEMQAADEGFSDVLTAVFPDAEWLRPERERAYVALDELFARAQRAGSLRADAAPADIGFVIWAFSGYLGVTRRLAPDAWRRYVALLLDGFRAAAAHPLPAAPPTEMQQLAAARRRADPRSAADPARDQGGRP